MAAVLAIFLLSPLAVKPWAASMIAPMFVLFSASGIAPLYKGVLLYGWAGMEEMVGLKWVLAQGGMYLLGLMPFLVSAAISSPRPLEGDSLLTLTAVAMARKPQARQIRRLWVIPPAFPYRRCTGGIDSFRGPGKGVQLSTQPRGVRPLPYS